jgi:hypothetical protein
MMSARPKRAQKAATCLFVALEAACSAQSVLVPEPAKDVAVTTTALPSAPPEASSASISAAKPASSDAPRRVTKDETHRIALPVKGAESCTLLLVGELVPQPDAWFLRTVTRIEAEPNESCKAHLLYDGHGPPVGGKLVVEAIPMLFWLKPGHSLAPDAASDFAAFSSGLQDLNFDGYVDICSAADDMSERPQLCWVFDPAMRIFVYHEELDSIPHLRVEGARLVGSTHSGSVSEGLEYAWVKGKAELKKRTTSYLGQRPDGAPAPDFSFTVTEELRAGKVVKTSQRAARIGP